ncbi:hypothetical protein BD410DRAFT_901470 [Rickenella mellea]|uniref:Uncharacterized protein n=1 Tax=Rickenella mellea TaxID=50990 RepID=A0A4Y7PQI5_9AGAM|nr:hypothetical protein BD410DRAFT_901470 [Rickenella mellea]
MSLSSNPSNVAVKMSHSGHSDAQPDSDFQTVRSLEQTAPQLVRYGPAQSLNAQPTASAMTEDRGDPLRMRLRKATDLPETPKPSWRPVRKGPYGDLDNLDDNIMKQIERLPGILAYVRLDYDATLEAAFPSHPCSPLPFLDDPNSGNTSDYNAFPMLIYSIAIGFFSPHEVEVDFFVLDKEASPSPSQEPSGSFCCPLAANDARSPPPHPCIRIDQVQTVKVSVAELNATVTNLLAGPRASDTFMADLAANRSSKNRMDEEWTDISVIYDLPPTQESSRQLLQCMANRDPRIIRAKDRTSQNIPAWLHGFFANIIPWSNFAGACYPQNSFLSFCQEYHFLRDDIMDMYAALTTAELPRPLEVRDDLALLPVTNNHCQHVDLDKGDVAVWNISSFLSMDPVKYLLDKQTLRALALCNKSLILPCRNVLFCFLSFTIRPETTDSLSHRLQELHNLILRESEIANVGEEYKFLVDDTFIDKLDDNLGHALRPFASFVSKFVWIRLKVDVRCSSPPSNDFLCGNSPVFRNTIVSLQKSFGFANILPPSSAFEVTMARRGEANLIKVRVNDFIQGMPMLEKMRNAIIDRIIESERIGLYYVEPYKAERMWLDWRMDNVKSWIAKREFQRKLSRWEPELGLDFLLDNQYIRPRKDTDAQMV